MQRLGQGEKVAAGSAIVLFVCMFLGWFNFGFVASNAWDSLHYASPILAIVIAATLTITFLEASGRGIDGIPTGSVIFALGCLAAVLVFFRLIDPVSAGEASPFGGNGAEAGSSPEAGLFLGLVAAAGIAGGGYLATGGGALDPVKKLFANSGGGPAPPQQPPPPPPASAAPLEPVKPAVSQAKPALPPITTPPQPARPVAPPPPPERSPPAEAAEDRATFCEQCGARLRESDRFCGECGQAAAAT